MTNPEFAKAWPGNRWPGNRQGNRTIRGYIDVSVFSIYILHSTEGHVAIFTCSREIESQIGGVVDLFNLTNGHYADLDPKDYLQRLLPPEAQYGD